MPGPAFFPALDCPSPWAYIPHVVVQKGTNGTEDGDPPKQHRPGQFKPGRSGNPAGRPKGVPNYNRELWGSIRGFRVAYQLEQKGQKGKKGKAPKISWVHAMLLRALTSDAIMIEIIRKIAATPADPQNDAGEATGKGGQTLVNILLADPAVRQRVAELDESIGTRLSVSGGNGGRSESGKVDPV